MRGWDSPRMKSFLRWRAFTQPQFALYIACCVIVVLLLCFFFFLRNSPVVEALKRDDTNELVQAPNCCPLYAEYIINFWVSCSFFFAGAVVSMRSMFRLIVRRAQTKNMPCVKCALGVACPYLACLSRQSLRRGSSSARNVENSCRASAKVWWWGCAGVKNC